MILPPKGSDWEVSHPKIYYQGVAIIFWLINDQSIFSATQQTDKPKSYAFW